MQVGAYAEGMVSDYLKSINNMVDENGEYVGDLDLRLQFYHAGFCLGYIYKSEMPINIGLSSRFGWGSIKWKSLGENEPPKELEDNVFVITPKLDIGFNLLPWVKMVVSGGYRFVTGIGGETYQYKSSGYPYNAIYEKGIFQVTSFDSYVVNIGFYFGNFN